MRDNDAAEVVLDEIGLKGSAIYSQSPVEVGLTCDDVFGRLTSHTQEHRIALDKVS